MQKQNNKNFDNNEAQLDELSEEYVSGEEYRDEIKALKPKIQNGVTWKQKLAAVFLIVFGLSAFILWIVQFRSDLRVGEPLTSKEIAELEESRQDANADVLRDQDTDQDGLSDYDELYFYETSPYLEDTDSDGLEDKQEIEQGKDPNCPLGQECFSAETSTNSTDENSQTQSEPEFDMEAFNNYVEQSESDANLDVSDTDLEKQIIEDILSGQADPSSLRELLKRSGMDERMLNQIDDENLINTYKNTLQTK